MSTERRILTAAVSVARDSWFALRAPALWSFRPKSPTDHIYLIAQNILHRTVRTIMVASVGFRLRFAESVTIKRLEREGLCANILHVLEVLYRVSSNTSVHIDWRLDGSERGFRYGKPGQDVWAALFEPLAAAPKVSSFVPKPTLHIGFWGAAKEFFDRHRDRQTERNEYHALFSSRIRITSGRVLAHVKEVHDNRLKGKFRIGVHKRVGNANVHAVQLSGELPSIDAFVRAARTLVEESRTRQIPLVIYLATDDVDAVDAFRKEFGDVVTYQEASQRTRCNAREIHFQPWNRNSSRDAEDMMIDVMLLASCDVLVHSSSSVSTLASIMNPRMSLVAVK